MMLEFAGPDIQSGSSVDEYDLDECYCAVIFRTCFIGPHPHLVWDSSLYIVMRIHLSCHWQTVINSMFACSVNTLVITNVFFVNDVELLLLGLV